MKLEYYTQIENCFGNGAKYIDVKHPKGIIFMSNHLKILRYDEIHIGRFLALHYQELFRYASEKIKGRLVFKVEYSVLKVCLVRKTKTELKLLKTFTIGLFYQRDLNLLKKALNISIAIDFIQRNLNLLTFKEAVDEFQNKNKIQLSNGDVYQITQSLCYT